MKKILFVLTIVLIITLGAVYFLYPKTLKSLLPNQIEGAKPIRIVQGEKALSQTQTAHREDITHVEEVVIGFYPEGTTIWISRYSSSATAKRETKKMTQAMKRFGQGFEKQQTLNISSQTVYQISPQGKLQYFWCQNNFMIYVAPESISQDSTKKIIKTMHRKITYYSWIKL